MSYSSSSRHVERQRYHPRLDRIEHRLRRGSRSPNSFQHESSGVCSDYKLIWLARSLCRVSVRKFAHWPYGFEWSVIHASRLAKVYSRCIRLGSLRSWERKRPNAHRHSCYGRVVQNSKRAWLWRWYNLRIHLRRHRDYTNSTRLLWITQHLAGGWHLDVRRYGHDASNSNQWWF